MAGKFNSKNRRLAKLRAKGIWFKFRIEVDPPSMQEMKAGEDSSRRMENGQEDMLGDRIPEDTERSNRGQEVSIVTRKTTVQQDENLGVENRCSRKEGQR